MATAPYGVRLLVGAAVTAIEETRKLPQTILMYPMTVVSSVAHIVMKVQQDLADLVIKGDSALENIFPPRDEQPEWATFDEDAEGRDIDRNQDGAVIPGGDGERRTEGRFALYSVTDGGDAPPAEASATPAPTATVTAPAIAAELDYESLTLAQLRARMQSLSVADLETLLAYEEASKARAPFQTLLANRITRASAK
ncbi:lipid droplet-associated protein [Mycolicibacterium sp. CBM1]